MAASQARSAMMGDDFLRLPPASENLAENQAAKLGRPAKQVSLSTRLRHPWSIPDATQSNLSRSFWLYARAFCNARRQQAQHGPGRFRRHKASLEPGAPAR